MSTRYKTAQNKVYDTGTGSTRLELVCEAITLEWAVEIAKGLNTLDQAQQDEGNRFKAALEAQASAARK